MNTKSVIKIDYIKPPYYTLSIAIDNYEVDENGSEFFISRSRQGFSPGEIEAAKAYMGLTDGPEVDYLNSLWTPEVIAAYQAMIAAQMPPQEDPQGE